MDKKIRVLVVDDSAVIRKLISKFVSDCPDMELVGTAPDPYVARDKILKLEPDVLTLDVEMPKMDGLTFLEKLMASRPMPVLMISSLTERGCDTTFKALELGAFDFDFDQVFTVILLGRFGGQSTVGKDGDVFEQILDQVLEFLRRLRAEPIGAGPQR